MKNNWEITQEEFDRLLDWLDPEREKAAKKFLLLRERFVKIFLSRGCHEAEDVFYDTMGRIARKPLGFFAGYDGDPVKYIYGVAHNVFLEWTAKQPSWGELPNVLTVRHSETDEARTECQEYCLEQLETKDREMLARYFRGQGQPRIDERKVLAKERHLTENALRLRISRLRQAVIDCLDNCLK